MQLSRRIDISAHSRWLGLGGSLVLHGIAFASALSFQREGSRAIPGDETAVSIVWEEPVVPSKPASPPIVEVRPSSVPAGAANHRPSRTVRVGPPPPVTAPAAATAP